VAGREASSQMQNRLATIMVASDGRFAGRRRPDIVLD
jgi:hypothetical protein